MGGGSHAMHNYILYIHFEINCKICMKELHISCFKKVVLFKHVLNGPSQWTTHVYAHFYC